MTSPIDAIIGHYRANERCHIDVPEWGPEGVPLRIHWKRLNPSERTHVNEVCANDVDVFVLKAQDEHGKAMFTKEHKAQLARAGDAAIISRVVAAMLGQTKITNADVDAALKN